MQSSVRTLFEKLLLLFGLLALVLVLMHSTTLLRNARVLLLPELFAMLSYFSLVACGFAFLNLFKRESGVNDEGIDIACK